MDINFNCDRCGQHLTVDDTSVGMSVQCPKCRHNLIIPNPETTRRAEKNCPYCGEKILAVASKCKHCGEILTAKTPNPLPPPPPEPSAKKPVVDPFISSPKERPVAPRILGVVGAIIDIAIAVAAFADGQILAGFSFIGAGVAFLVIAPLAWAIGDAFRKYAQPSFYFAKGAVDLAKKRFFWTYGPQLIGVAAGFGILFWLAFIVADVRDKTKKPASHDGTLVHSAVMSDSRRVSELQEQLKQLDVEKQQKLNAVESDCDLELKNVNKDILDLIQLINVAQQKLADLKSQHDPVAEQLKPLQAQRDTIEAKYERQISDAELQIKNGIAAADKYKTEMLAGTAKLINDAIIANNLSIDLVPKNGIYATTESRGEDDIEPDGWTGGHWGGGDTLYRHNLGI